MDEFTEPGTIDRLVADALAAGHQVSARLIRDWTELGLLDYPKRQPAGRGHGSRQALYPASQRNLFAALLHHRSSNRVTSLTRIPVAIWLYWGDDFVPTRQVRRAMNTWIKDPRANRRQARDTAREVLMRLDNPAASEVARKQLLETVADVAYTGRPDFEILDTAIRNVFQPYASQIPKAVGHPGAPLMADTISGLVRARLAAISKLKSTGITDEEFDVARRLHLISFAEYAVQQPDLASWAPSSIPHMYEPATGQAAFNNSCGNLLTMIGLMILNPDRVSQAALQPVPKILFQ